MLLLCWNVAGRLTRMHEQAELVLGLGADLISLQELTPATRAGWVERLESHGYRVAGADMPAAREGSGPLGVLTAALADLQLVSVEGVPWPERVLAVRLAGLGGLEVINVHSPISPKPDLAKVRTHEAVFGHLTGAAAGHPRLVCGDLNTPRREHPDGSVWTFARTRHGSCGPSGESAGTRPRPR
jgi:exonuclease III